MAEGILEDAIVSASEFVTVPGNTVEKYVDGLIEIGVDTTGMDNEELELLRRLLIIASQKEINKSAS